MEQQLHISLAYAPTVDDHFYLETAVPVGTTLYQALNRVGWLDKFELLKGWCDSVAVDELPSAKQWHVGVFSQKQPLNYVLQNNDRIEVYRSLIANPMQRRQKRAT